MKTIKVTIDPEGAVKMEAIGYTGADCEQDTAELEAALGFSGKRIAKPERFQTAAQKASTKQ